MIERKKFLMGFMSLAAALTLSACSDAGEEKKNDKSMEKDHGTEENMNMDHSGMNHSGSSEVPEGLKEAENPTFGVGSKAIMNADHMEGMNGTEATISGAFTTTVYSVTYTPTTGGEKVEDHKWVIHEELKDASHKPYETGEEVVLDTEHMQGMKGAKAVVVSAEETTVYMVDYTPADGGEKVTNHKWVTESELSEVK